jgi:hypothetical protein
VGKKITSTVQFTFLEGEKNKKNSKSFQCITGDLRFSNVKKFLEGILRISRLFYNLGCEKYTPKT